MVVWGGFANSWGKKKSKRQRGKERYTQLNAEFQRTARRDEESLLKWTMQRNRMRQTSDLFKKIGDTKGTFHAKMGAIKIRNSKDITKTEDTKKRCQEYTEELYQKGLNDPDNQDSMVTYLEPDILECEVKWALGSITMNKAGGGGRIPAELFKILKCYSLEGPMPKLKLQHFGCLIQGTNSLEKILMLGEIGKRRRRQWQRMRRVAGITDSVGMSLSKLRESGGQRSL